MAHYPHFMEERQHTLLAHVVRSYIARAEPVSSQALAGALGVSSATIRNQMAELEAEGYLTQPHTSAGRVPTLKGYQFYLDNLVRNQEPKVAEQRTLRDLVHDLRADQEQLARHLARALATLTGEAAVVGFGSSDVYYTGLSNLFGQPEFQVADMVRAMGLALDHLDEAMSKLYRELEPAQSVVVKIGSANPFGQGCALIFTTYPAAAQSNVIGILGPLRMDYEANLARLQYVRALFGS